MFSKLKKQVQNNFKELQKTKLFSVTIDRELIWEKYLSGFAEEVRQEHNCNCCKSFLRQFGSIVTIKDNKIVSLWDFDDAVLESTELDEYGQSIQNLREYIHSLPITDVFLNSFAKCGTDKNFDSKRQRNWKHFFIELPREYVESNVDTLLSEARSSKQVFKRSLDELTIDATETVLELIAQNSLYRGKEYKNVLNTFLKLQKDYKKVSANETDNFCWVKSNGAGMVAHIRNTAIGTLLIDLSEGLDLEDAVKKYERVVAPANYKRPTALASKKQIEQAKATLTELGLLGSLNRRFARESDLNVNDVLYTYKASPVQDVFGELAKEVTVNPKTLHKVEEISIEDFIQKVLPTAKSVEVLFENSHQPNLVSLITAEDKDTPSLFKWDNPFSWSYNKGVADSMKENVKAAGGKVDGALRFSIQWNENGDNNIDFDAHCMLSNGEHTCFRTFKAPAFGKSGSQLDVDVISPNGKIAVENITWAKLDGLPVGIHKFWVNNYSVNTSKGGFKAEVEFDGEIYAYEYGKNLRGEENIQVAEVTMSPDRKLSIKSVIPSNSSISSTKVWNMGTNQFHKVSKILLSPNYWGEKAVGNKHYMFMLDGCHTDDVSNVRPFFNEFLKPELASHGKAMEMVGSKLKVDGMHQISGLGFSDTIRNHVFARVSGSFNRTLKITF